MQNPVSHDDKVPNCHLQATLQEIEATDSTSNSGTTPKGAKAIDESHHKIEDSSASIRNKFQKSYTRQKQGSQFFKEADIKASKIRAQLWGVHEQHDEISTWLDVHRNNVVECLETLKFQCFIGGVISLNAVIIGLESDAMAKNQKLTFLFPIEVMFTFVYTVEICVKIFGYGSNIIKDLGFVFDFFLVLLAITDTFILSAIDVSSQLSQFMMLRMLRLFKLARILRLLKLFRSLWLLLSSIIDSLRLLVWCGILLTILLYFAGIVTTQIIGARLSSDIWEEDDRYFLSLRFGSVERSMYTLFECMVGGDLTYVARVVYKGLPWMWVFFVVYSCIAVIAILNVIVAVIVENTMQNTIATNRENKRLEIERQHALLRQDLITLFNVADSTGDGTLSRDEWVQVLENEEVMKSIRHLQLTKDQCLHIFDALDTDGSKSLDSMEFLEGVMKGVHAVRVYDVMTLSSDLQRIEERTQTDVEALSSSVKRIEATIKRQGMGSKDACDPEANARGLTESPAKGKTTPLDQRIEVLESRIEKRIQSIELQQATNFERMQASLNALLTTQTDNKGLCASFPSRSRR